MKRSNWLQSVASASGTGPLTADAGLELAQLDELLFGAWNHGKPVFLGLQRRDLRHPAGGGPGWPATP